MTSFGILQRLELRDIWKNEAKDFTPWLAEHIQELGDSLGLELELTQREANVGDFSLDLLAKDLGTGKIVIIENQLSRTDHDHLGKLLTYASGFDASTVIWIAETIRDEHRQALEWLNQRTDSETHFFGVVIEVLKIDFSKPAFNFKPIVFPNEWQKTQRKRTENSISPRGEAYKEFFQNLIDELRENHRFTGAKIGQPQNWYSFASGHAGVTYGASFGQGAKARVELYIDLGDFDKNKLLFDNLMENKNLIEEEFGETFTWERLDEKRASRIAIYRPGSIDDDKEVLVAIRAWMIERLLKFKQVFSKRLKKHQKIIRA
ncbi:MAG: DUF4268 domain-containing protein [Anaerolineales bacterium]|nr:DUF4268 domain-containing protein [Anaerolineales bacterium]